VRLDRDFIERVVPQSGDMCLLDCVEAWDGSSILCSAAAPHSGHPLMRNGSLSGMAGCEFAAQAAAVHGALLDDAKAPRQGMLAKLMDVRFELPQFALATAVHARAEALGRTAAGCLYAFDVGQDGLCVVRGRLMVAFAPDGGY
jgi:predicted hotdog family 3-hydroxylacyl-ACP dehydratase